MNDSVVATLLDRFKAKCDDYNEMRAQYEEKFAECTRLRAELDEYKQMALSEAAGSDHREQEIERLKAENVALRNTTREPRGESPVSGPGW